MNAVPNLESFQQQLASLQQSYAQLGKMIRPEAPAPLTLQEDEPKRVDGIAGAHKFLDGMGPNTTGVVWDLNADKFYWLHKDANGVPSRIMVGDFTLTPEPLPEDKYATKDDLIRLEQKLDRFFEQKGVSDSA